MIIALLGACAPEPAAPDAAPNTWEARVAYARPEPAAETPIATLPAAIVAAPGTARDLGPPADGRLVAWHVAPGDAVLAGDVLAELRAPGLVDLDADAGDARAALAAAERQVALLEAAVASGVASRADLTAASADRDAARARADGSLRRQRAHRDTADADRWLAPADGVVAEIRCALGPVRADEVCLRLVDVDATALHVPVPERYLDQVGDDVHARLDDDPTPLTLLAASPVVDPTRRARDLWFTSPAARIGAVTRATLWVAADGVARLPAAALTSRDGQHEVFVRRAEGLPAPTAVDVVGNNPTHTYVRGLSPDDEVVVRGVFLVRSLVALAEEG